VISAPAVTVVVPAYRAEAFIERAACSVLEQAWTDWELVIASDDTVDYAALLRGLGLTDARVRCVFTGGTGTGSACARNAGLDAAAGRVVAMLDADDRMEKAALEILVPLAREHGVAYSALRIVDHATDQDLPSYDRPLATGPVTLEDVFTSQVHGYAGIVFDRHRVRARWPATREMWDDVSFVVRCFDHVDRMMHVADSLYVYYVRDGSICNRPETGHEFLLAAEDLLGRIGRGDTIGVASDAGRVTYQRFLRGRLAIESTFLENMAAGRCLDFRDFVSRNLALFHQLP